MVAVLSMEAQDAINITQQAMLTALLLGAPVLLAGVLVGLIIGLAQALTQVQDQTVAFVPKIIAMVAVLILCLPWLIQKMVEYSEVLITNIPKTISGG
jgi:flagellar biosynthesis protein FliQ